MPDPTPSKPAPPLGPPVPTPLSPHPAPARLHLWQIQWVRDLMVVASIVAVLYLGYQIRIVTVPLLLGLTLAYLFEPLVRWLVRKRLASRNTAAAGIIVALVLLFAVPLVIGSGFAVVHGARAVSDLAASASKVQASVEKPDDEALRAAVPPGGWLTIRDMIAARRDPDPTFTPAPDPAPEQSGVVRRFLSGPEMRELGHRAVAWLGEHAAELSATLGRHVATSGAQAARAALTTATTIGSIIFQLVLTAFFFFALSTRWDAALGFGGSLIPDARRPRTVQILMQMDRAIAGFVRGRITICLILAVYFTLAYWLAGAPLPFVLGPIVGMLCIVPYLQLLGIPVAMLLMWLHGVHGPIVAPELAAASGGLWWILLAPPVIHFIANAFDDYVLNPVIQGKHTELAMPMIVFASIAGGALAGIYGLLLAIPVAACLRILLKEVFFPRVQAWVRGEAKDVLPIGRE